MNLDSKDVFEYPWILLSDITDVKFPSGSSSTSTHPTPFLFFLKKWVFLSSLPYFLEYIPGPESNPVSNWTRDNLLIQIENFVFLSLDFNPLSIWTRVIMEHEIS